MHKQQKEKIHSKIEEMEDKNPTEFWKLIDEIKGKKSNTDLDHEIFLQHFKNLHNPPNSNLFDDDFAEDIIKNVSQNSERIKIDVLDSDITPKELLKTAKTLKNKKKPADLTTYQTR